MGASPPSGPGATVAPPGDGAAYSAPQIPAPRTWATGPEVYALVALDAERRGKRLYPQLPNHVRDLYDVLVRRAAQAGAGVVVISKGQLAIDLYPDCRGDRAAQERKKRSIANWLQLLYRIGLVRRLATQRRRDGRDAAIVLQLLPVPADAGERAQACGARRRRETRQQAAERRIRPFCRRSGQKGVNRYVTAEQPDEPAAKRVVPPEPVGPRRGSRGRGAHTSALSPPRDFAPPGPPDPGNPYGVPRGRGAQGINTDAQISDAARGEAREGFETRDQAATVRQTIRAALAAPLGGGAAPPGAGPLITEGRSPRSADAWHLRLARQEALLDARRAVADRLAVRTFPTYGQLYDVAMLAVGAELLHARAALRPKLEQAARRYDRYALRLADVDELADSPPTALAQLLALADAAAANVQSVGYFARGLDRASKQLRRRWRAIDPDHDANAQKRRQRRLARRAQALRGRVGGFRTGAGGDRLRSWAGTGPGAERLWRLAAELDRQALEHADALRLVDVDVDEHSVTRLQERDETPDG